MNEHLHGWEPIIQRLGNHATVTGQAAHGAVEQVLMRRVRQLEALSRYVYARVATSPAHRDQFRDKTIRAFWDLSADEQRKRWTQPLNIDAIE
jgi:hypothetical protein